MNRLTACAIVILLWAAIYLPGLGSTEIKGEEGRRILPAITMLETGNWLVPYVGGKPFLRKPPLINWVIAMSFKLTGIRNEWTARLPSALCVLALALTIVGTSGAGWISVETGFVAAAMAMTQFGLLAKARFAGAEIEGIYAPLSGIAIVCWLAWWSRGRSPWLVWVVPGAVLGVASLAKGPSFHLIFFYAIAFTVLGAAKRWRDLRHPAPFVGLMVSSAIFAAWAIPYFQTAEAKGAAAVWKRQGIDRFTDSEFNAGSYALNIPRALGDQLPWLLFAPLALARFRRDPAIQEPDEELVATVERPLVWATSASFVAVLLIPGALPRYVLPLGAPIALILAIAISHLGSTSRIFARWHLVNRLLAALLLLACLATPFVVAASEPGSSATRSFAVAIKGALCCAPLLAACAFILARRPIGLNAAGLAAATGAALGIASILYAIAAVPWINRCDNIRPVAAKIDATIPPGEPLVIYDPSYLSAIFYLRTPYRYATVLEEIPDGPGWVLARGKEREKFAAKRPDLAVAKVIGGKKNEEFLLLQGRAGIQKLPAP